MQIDYRYDPLDAYRPFHASGATERFLVGGFGSGKTIALCNDAVVAGLEMPGAKIAMARRTAPEVKMTLEPEFVNAMPPELYAASKKTRAGGHLETLLMPNGTLYYFLHVDDWMKHKSLNISRLYVDELSEFDEQSYVGLRGRTRQRERTPEARAMGFTDPIPDAWRGVAAASNPAGHDWMWRRWVDRPTRRREHWVVTSLDNPYLGEEYLATLMEMPDAWIKRYVFASFDEFGGLVYPEWGWNTHMLQEPFEIGKLTPIWMALDPGTRHPQGAIWCAVHGNKLVAVHEELHPDWDIDKWTARMRKAEAKLDATVTWRAADPHSMHVRDRGSMVSLHAQYRRRGFTFHDWPADPKDRIPMLGTLIKQKRFLATKATPQLYEQISNYRWEDLTEAMKRKLGAENEAYGPEKVVKVNDDLVDCAQGLSAKWIRPHKVRHKHRPKARSRWHAESMEIQDRIARQRTQKRYNQSHDLGMPV